MVVASPVRLVRQRLDDAGLEAHLRRIATTAEQLELRVKTGAGHTSAPATTLDEAGRQLVAGDAVAIQIWFREGDAWWCDTLLRAKDGYRLVRLRDPL